MDSHAEARQGWQVDHAIAYRVRELQKCLLEQAQAAKVNFHLRGGGYAWNHVGGE
jgi:hypothetical protein